MVPLLIITITITLNNVIKCSHQIKLTPPLYLPLDLAKTSKIYRVWARRVIRLSFFMSSCFGAKHVKISYCRFHPVKIFNAQLLLMNYLSVHLSLLLLCRVKSNY